MEWFQKQDSRLEAWCSKMWLFIGVSSPFYYTKAQIQVRHHGSPQSTEIESSGALEDSIEVWVYRWMVTLIWVALISELRWRIIVLVWKTRTSCSADEVNSETPTTDRQHSTSTHFRGSQRYHYSISIHSGDGLLSRIGLMMPAVCQHASSNNQWNTLLKHCKCTISYTPEQQSNEQQSKEVHTHMTATRYQCWQTALVTTGYLTDAHVYQSNNGKECLSTMDIIVVDFQRELILQRHPKFVNICQAWFSVSLTSSMFSFSL